MTITSETPDVGTMVYFYGVCPFLLVAINGSVERGRCPSPEA
jgi:hypothetical protein